jgi:hypothetical protein
MTAKELIEILKTLPSDQHLVFSDVRYGDFDVVGDTGARLSEDNYVQDFRPILRLQKRKD